VLDDVPEHVHYTAKQKEYILEKKIRELAQLDERLIKEKALGRPRRQIQPLPVVNQPTTPPPFQLPGITPPPDFKQLKKMLGLPDDMGESPDAEHGQPKVVVLEPWAFQHRIGGFVILEGIVLSPVGGFNRALRTDQALFSMQSRVSCSPRNC
jgi:hypothetical protein